MAARSAPHIIRRPPDARDAEHAERCPPAARRRCSWMQLIACAVVVEVALALAATFFLDWPVSEDEGSASASAAAATSLNPSPPVEVEQPPRQLAVRLRVDQLVLHRLPPRVQACVSMDWWPNDKCDYGDCLLRAKGAPYACCVPKARLTLAACQWHVY